MQFFRHLPIKRKLMAITMLVSGAALLVACAGFIAYDQAAARKQMARDLAVTAAVTGANCTAGLSFDDAGSVGQALNSLSAKPDIAQACVYDPSGRPFARYLRDGAGAKMPPPILGTPGYRFDHGRLELFQPIALAGETIGTIYLEEDLNQLGTDLWHDLLIVALMLVAAAGVALFLSLGLQRVISQPLSDLAKIVTTVASEKNYSVRAAKSGNDELGSLIDGFNEMLAQIQERDATLERRVSERTGELVSSLSLLNATLDSTADGILAVDLAGKVICHNHRFLDLWGLPSELLRAGSAELLSFVSAQVKEPEHFMNRIAKAQENPEAETFAVIELKDGRIFEEYKKPQRLAGRSVGVVINLRDVTERKRAEQQLAESRNFLDRIINAVADPIFVKDRHHRGVLVNDAFCNLMGRKREELLGKSDHDHDCFPPAQADEFRAKDDAVFETGNENINEETLTSADGTLHHLITKKALYTDEKGEKFIVGVSRDVTSQKKIEREIVESRALYTSLVEQLPAGIFRKDLDGRYVLVNSWFCRLRQLKPEQILGKTPAELAAATTAEQAARHPQAAGLLRQGADHHRQILQTGRRIEVDEQYPGPDGQPLYLHVIKSPVFGPDGVVVGSQGILLDVTEHRRAEAELNYERNLLRTLIDHIPDYIYVRDLSNRFVVANQSLARLMGVAGPSALIGKRDADFYPPDAAENYDKSDHEVFGGRPFFNRERVIRFPNGEELVTLNTKVPFKNDRGEVIGLIGVGRDVSDRKRAEAELKFERELLRSLLDRSEDTIYFKDLESRFIRSSAAQARQFKVAGPEALVGKSDTDFFTAEHAQAARADEQEIIRTGKPLIAKLEKETWPGGRVTWALTNKMPLRNAAGDIIGTFGISKDITPIKEAEARLEAVHRQLLETSRQAGMAEVATSVLHNVGNVLNSINVSTTLVLDRFKKSRLGNLGQLAALIQEQRDGLAAFFTTDPRGRQLPDYLAKLAEHLAAERADLVTEIELTRKNIEHIKDVVTMQQNYAKVSGVVEKVEVTDLVEDALRMNAGALARHDVHVVRDYPAEAIVINVERQKVLQILVNLIRNAKYACDDSGRPGKLLTVQVRAADGRVQIVVLDNGVGIPAENLTRIFNHGFTTRENGHGFGLHSGALAAKELGGTLTVHSDGPGRGAAFTLKLPLGPNLKAGPQPWAANP
jgi:PAS domain S-box-containing protein